MNCNGMIESNMKYGVCPDCLIEYKPVWFIEEEWAETSDGYHFKTGRKRRAVRDI